MLSFKHLSFSHKIYSRASSIWQNRSRLLHHHPASTASIFWRLLPASPDTNHVTTSSIQCRKFSVCTSCLSNSLDGQHSFNEPLANAHPSDNNVLSTNLNDPTDTYQTTVQASGDTVVNSITPTTELFADHGLGGWDLPHHMIQSLLEVLHSSMGIHWVPTLMIVTVSLRLLAIPAYVKMRSFIARSNNNLPEQVKLQMQLRQATGFTKQKLAAEYMDFMKEKGTNPLKALLYQLPTGIIFMSFFVGLRGMAQAKLPSLTTGGLWWFQDLTIADPYFILPVLSCTSMHLLVRYGAASAEMGPAASMPGIQKFVMWMPFMIMPFIMFQPSAMFVFWMTSNAFSYCQMLVFLRPGFQRYFGIPELIKHPKHVMDQMNPFEQIRKLKQQHGDAERAVYKMRDHMNQLQKFSKEQKKREKE